ncbi:MAG: hypothetical protein HOP02_02185 [Methylococcaceae bacterium]|nr:hypothetical protein [Methylococcaceae bacterium]
MRTSSRTGQKTSAPYKSIFRVGLDFIRDALFNAAYSLNIALQSLMQFIDLKNVYWFSDFCHVQRQMVKASGEYYQATLKNLGNYVFELQSATLLVY